MNSRPTLSLCMIVKNEEEYLPRCLESVREIVTEIIIVDTGSTDSTIEIARSFGAKIFNFTWINDFAAARNFSLSQATGEWILVLDADETISKKDHAAMLNLISHPQSAMYMLIQTNYMTESPLLGWLPNDIQDSEAKGYPGYVESPLTRLFRNIPEIQFHGMIHENAYHKNDKVGTVISSIRIHHHGKYKNIEVLTKKNDFYLELCIEKCRKNPENFHYLYELGMLYFEIKEIDKGKEILLKAEEISPHYIRVQLALAGVAIQEQKHQEAIDRCMKILRLEPNSPFPYIYLVNILTQMKQYSFAEQIAEQGKRYVSKYPSFHLFCGFLKESLTNYRGAIISFKETLRLNPEASQAWTHMAFCHLQLNEFDSAKTCLEKARTFEKVKVVATKMLSDCYIRQGNGAQAFALLSTLCEENLADDEIYYNMGYFFSNKEDFAQADNFFKKIKNHKTLAPHALEYLADYYIKNKKNSDAEKIKIILENPS